jgi:hypothetical protein
MQLEFFMYWPRIFHFTTAIALLNEKLSVYQRDGGLTLRGLVGIDRRKLIDDSDELV